MKNLKKLLKKDKENIVTTTNGKLKKRVIEAIEFKVNATLIHPQQYEGTGRYIRLVSYVYEIESILNLLGLKFKVGNDAPKNGKNGYYIKISKTALKNLQSLIKSS